MKCAVELPIRLKHANRLFESSTCNANAVILRRRNVRVLALILAFAAVNQRCGTCFPRNR